MATVLLILGIGKKVTKRLNEFQKLDKKYITKIKLGAVSDAFDKEEKLKRKKLKKFQKNEEILKSFLGKIKQILPSFSAKNLRKKLAFWQGEELK